MLNDLKNVKKNENIAGEFSNRASLSYWEDLRRRKLDFYMLYVILYKTQNNRLIDCVWLMDPYLLIWSQSCLKMYQENYKLEHLLQTSWSWYETEKMNGLIRKHLKRLFLKLNCIFKQEEKSWFISMFVFCHIFNVTDPVHCSLVFAVETNIMEHFLWVFDHGSIICIQPLILIY